jgi:chemosensory pili system protein ChpC
MDNHVEQMRGVLISLPGGKLLLPNTNVSEIISYISPESVNDKPDWYLGTIRWKGYRLPLISFSMMVGWQTTESIKGAKIAILKALASESKMPYFAILTQGFPRLVNITSEQLLDDAEHNSEYYFSAYLNMKRSVFRNLKMWNNSSRRIICNYQSPKRDCSAAMTASPAVSVRSIRGPIHSP